MSTIKEALICPECSNIMGDNPKNPKKESICSECWMKDRKKIEMMKGIVSLGWDKRILKFNNQNILEKLEVVLKHKEGAKDISIILNDFQGPGIYFKTDCFGFEELNSIFHRWGLNWNEHVINFGISPTEIIIDRDGEEKTIPQVSVAIWVRKFPNMLTCDHHFIERNDWKYQICSKCGLFEKLSKKKIQNGKTRILFIEKEIDWKCPRCKSNSIALDVDKEHQHFEDQWRKLGQIMRCCDCGQEFVFRYNLTEIELDCFKPLMEEDEIVQ